MKKRFGIDIGSKSIRLIDAADGVIASIPSAAARTLGGKEIIAYGSEAVSMASRTPGSVELIWPIEDVSDLAPETVAGFINALFKSAEKHIPSRPVLAIAVPGEQSQESEKVLLDSCRIIGAEQVYLFDTLLAASYGSGASDSGHLVGLINIGAVYTDAVMFRDGEIVNYRSVRIGGNDIDKNIVDAVYEKYGVRISEESAENLKKIIGTLHSGQENEKKMTVTGRQRVLGVPVSVEVSSEDIRPAFVSVIDDIIDGVRTIFKQPKHEAEIIVLTGGMACLHGIVRMFSKEFDVKVVKPDHPEKSVADGVRIMLEKEIK